jgi:hypothetical protein
MCNDCWTSTYALVLATIRILSRASSTVPVVLYIRRVVQRQISKLSLLTDTVFFGLWLANSTYIEWFSTAATVLNGRRISQSPRFYLIVNWKLKRLKLFLSRGVVSQYSLFTRFSRHPPNWFVLLFSNFHLSYIPWVASEVIWALLETYFRYFDSV